MLHMCAALSTSPHLVLGSGLSHLFNMDGHESLSKRVSASLSSAPSEPVTSVGFAFLLAMHAVYGKISCCHCKMKLMHMVLTISQN